MSVTSVREGRPEDYPALAAIFYDAVHRGAAAHYTAEQRAAWAPGLPAPAVWAERLAGQTVLVAVREGAPVGFMTLTRSGHVDLSFVSPDHMRLGVGSSLMAALERRAAADRLSTLTTDASLAARAFFAAHGWTVQREQRVERGGVALTNLAMRKSLGP